MLNWDRYTMPDFIKKAVDEGHLKAEIFIKYLVDRKIVTTNKPIKNTSLQDCIFKGRENEKLVKAYFDNWGRYFIVEFEY